MFDVEFLSGYPSPLVRSLSVFEPIVTFTVRFYITPVRDLRSMDLSLESSRNEIGEGRSQVGKQLPLI